MVGGHHAAAHRHVNALDFGHVKCAGGVSDQDSARHFQLGQGLEPALDQGTGAGRDDLPAREQGMDPRVMLELLKCLERREGGVFVIQTDHEADVHAVLIQVVDKAAAVGFRIQWPAHGMLDHAGPGPARRQLPHFLESQAVSLRRAVGVQAEMLDRLLGQAAPATLGQNGHAGTDIHAGREGRSGTAVRLHAHVPTANADHPMIFYQQLGARETGKDVHADGLRPRAQFLNQRTERDDVISVILHLRGGRQTPALPARQEEKFVVARRDADRWEGVSPFGPEFVQRAGLHHGTGQGMGAEFGPLFQYAYRQVRFAGLETNGAGQSGGAAADHCYVVLHDITICHLWSSSAADLEG